MQSFQGAGAPSEGFGGMPNPFAGGGAGGGAGGAPSSPMGYLEQIPDVLKQYFAQYGQMLQDPTGIMSKFGKQFQASPGYQYQLGQGEQAIGHAAAAGGMAGSPMQQQQAGQMATGLASQDYYNFLNKALGLYGTGAAGEAGLGTSLASVLQQQSQLSWQQQQEKERKKAGLWSSIGSIVGSLTGQVPGEAASFLQFL